jgi:hypothetical protein
MELLPEIKRAIEFIAAAATGGVIGNRVDNWFVNLYYHEKNRIINWLNGWVLSHEDKLKIEKNENLKILFSQLISNVANETFEKKLLIWPSITESLLRNEDFKFDEKQYFISLFIKLDTFTINYLAKLYFSGPIDYQVVFPANKMNKPLLGENNFGMYLGQLQSSTSGMTDMYSENNSTLIKISDLGKNFMDFISNSSMEKIKQMAE